MEQKNSPSLPEAESPKSPEEGALRLSVWSGTKLTLSHCPRPRNFLTAAALLGGWFICVMQKAPEKKRSTQIQNRFPDENTVFLLTEPPIDGIL